MRKAAALAAPLALLALLVVLLVALNPGDLLATSAPPVEDVAFDRVVLEPGRLTLHVRNAAAQDVTIAQVLVDDAYWAFDMTPSTTLGKYDAGVIRMDYPWVEGEPLAVMVLTSAGTPFEHEVAVALPTPKVDASSLGTYALVGLLVGVLPIVAGMAFFPALREAAARWRGAVLAFTLGLLAFLAVDTVEDGMEMAEVLPGAYQGVGLFAAAALLAVVGVLALDGMMKRRGMGAATLAVLIALGIGLHNLGEGLLIGSAFAVGSLALGTALIVGFALHNVTEGPAIVAPLTRDGKLPLARFAGLAALAGLPTVGGAWLGAFASSGVLPVVFFGLGAGAIVVVLVQVYGSMRRDGSEVASPTNLLAFAAGFLVMMLTGFLVAG